MAAKNRFVPILSFGLLLMNLSGCQANQEEAPGTQAMEMSAPANISLAPSDAPQESSKEKLNPSQVFSPAMFKQEMVIREADVNFQVKDLGKSTLEIEKVVANAGAILVRSNQKQDSEEQETNFTIRVLPDKFFPLLSRLQKESTHLDKRSISTQDVGLEYADLQARTQAKKAIEARYIGLLKEAKNVEEILKVEEQLKEIREEIESTDARIRYLKNQVAYSTIRLTIYQLAPVYLQPESPNFLYRLAAAFSGGWQLIVSIMLGLLYVWPVLILAGVGYYFFRRRHRIAE